MDTNTFGEEECGLKENEGKERESSHPESKSQTYKFTNWLCGLHF